jgi:drug/metabolite transporter (DMT)-like permease
MSLEAGVFALVLLAAVIHAIWNALVKSSDDSWLASCVLFGTGSVLCALCLPFAPAPARESWPFLAAGVVLHNGYMVFLMLAYRAGDLSHVYPLARGSAPLLVAAASAPVAGEFLSPQALVGVALVSAGIAALALDRGLAREGGRRAVVYALTAGCWIASYTLVDGLGVRRGGSTLGYILWLQALEAVPFVLGTLALRGRELLAFARRRGGRGAIGGALAAIGYALVLWAYSLGALAPIAALRETSTILAAWIGTRLLGEPFGRRRIVASVLVAAGIVALNL